MIVGSRGRKYHGHSTKRVKGLIVACACVAVALAGWSASAQVPLGWSAAGTVDSSTTPFADPAIATDGAGNWVTIFSSNSGGADDEILVQTSSDNGVTWSTAVPLNTNAGVDVDDDSTPSLATNGTDWVAAWQAAGMIQMATSTDAGATWSAPAALGAGLSPSVAVNSGPVVAFVNPAGDVAISPSAATIPDGSAGSPAVATDGGTTFVVAYESGADIGVATSTDGGATFSAPMTFDSGGLDAGPSAGFDPAVGTWIVGWNTDTGISVVVSADGGATWSPPLEILTGSATTDPIAAATDGSGNWTLIFAQAGADSDIIFSTSDDSGLTWSDLRFIADTATNDGNPAIATGSGQWIAVWDAVGALETLVHMATAVTTTTLLLGGGGDDGPCFIASAAYGTPMAKDIEVLRRMRDTYLMNNALGMFFVDAYYSISPAIADQVAQHPWAASLVRAFLIPVLFVVELFMRAPVPFLLMGLFGVALIVRRRMVTRQTA